MSEKPPQFERPPIPVFGPVLEEEKQKVSEGFQQKFKEGEFTELTDDLLEKIRKLEYEKKSYELGFITVANQIINRLREKYGLPAFDVSEKNIHILPPELFKSFTTKPFSALHDYQRQLIAADAEKLRSFNNRIVNASTLFHEMEHLKGFLSLDIIQKDGKTKVADRRIGLMVSEGYKKAEKDEWYESFRGLNEAVVSELECRHGLEVASASSDPVTQKEIKWLTSEEALNFKKEALKNRSIALEEIEWISRDGKIWIFRPYRELRRVLQYIVKQISEKVGKKIEDVYDLFFKAHFTGDIREIAYLIDHAFGKGSFRVVGMMTGEHESASQMLDHLRKQGVRIKHAKKN